MSRNDDHTKGNLLENLYHQKLIGIDLSRQKNTRIPQQINFIGKLEEDNGTTMFFIAEKQFITKTDATTVVDPEDLDLLTSMCNLIEYKFKLF